jgi:uncharacterized membrane protein
MFELLMMALVGYGFWSLRDGQRRLESLESQVAALRAVPSAAPPNASTIAATEAPLASPDMTRPAVPPVVLRTVPPIAPAAPGGPSFEELVGTRWTVWAGGIALAAGALLLVRYSIEQGVFGPGVRVMLGGLLASVLVGLGEWFRRSKVVLPIDAVPSAHIPSVLTAAGTVAAFGTVFAAHALYGFLGPASAFLLLGAVGLATMAAAALHGPALAGLGLVGALVTPLLVASTNSTRWPLVLYLAVVAAAAYGLARFRRWLWLAVSVVVGAVLWGLVLATTGGLAVVHPMMAHALAQLLLAAVFIAVEPHLDVADKDAGVDGVATGSLAALTLLVCFVLGATRASDAGWLLFASSATTVLAMTGWRSVPAAWATVFAGLVVLAVAATWPDLRGQIDSRSLWPAVGDYIRVPDLQRSYLTTLAILALGVSAAATSRLWTGSHLRTPVAGAYAVAAVVTPLLVLAYAYLRVTQFDNVIWFGGLAAVLAAGFYGVTTRLAVRPAAGDTTSAALRLALGAFAAGTMAAIALAFVFSLDRGYLTVALALTAAATAWIAAKAQIPALRVAIAALGLAVLARLLWEPRIMGSDGVGTTPILNWLLLGYGVPAVAFALAGHWLKRDRTHIAAQISDALGVIFAGLLGFYQIRHLLNDGDIFKPTSSHIEAGMMALLAIAFAYALNRIELRRRNPVFAIAVMIFGGLASLSTFAGLLLFENPFFNREAVIGPSVLSSLLLAYLVPGLAAVVFARHARTNRQHIYMTLGAILAIVLIFAYATLETRHVFQGTFIYRTQATSSAEMWAYSAVWLVLGMILLGYGVVRGSFEARVASGLLVLLATLKAFLFDLAGLTGIWRPLSFICLGAVLIGIGVVYQRFVFAPRAVEPGARVPVA